MVDLPAHIKDAQLPRIAEKSTEGMGVALPPHISIRGNEFTLIDGSGEKRAVDTKHLDVVVADMSDVMCKLYYGKEWSPDSNDPPICWSANGFAPSKDAMQPQSPTCASCPHNVRGSAVSKLTGAPIKACRDEKWMAVAVPGYDIGFQFRVTPGSFANWRAYSEKFKGQNFDVRDVITRMSFAKDANGVVTFAPTEFASAEMVDLRNKLFQGGATAILVGRTDVPIAGAALPEATTVPVAAPALTAPAPETAPTAPAAAPKPRGRPRKEAAAPETAPANGPAAPFRPQPAPAFGVAPSAPPPPAEVANQVASFFSKGQ